MEPRSVLMFYLVLQFVFTEQFTTSTEEKSPRTRKLRELTSEYARRYLLDKQGVKRLISPSNNRDMRKKPPGNLRGLKTDDIDIDDIVSVAVGPPPSRLKHNPNRTAGKQLNRTNTVTNTRVNYQNAIDFVKDILSQLGRELLTKQVSEDFVFGQYVGNAMKNLTSQIKLKVQHEILDIIVKYQKLNTGIKAKNDAKKKEEDAKKEEIKNKEVSKDVVIERKSGSTNETEDSWTDFTNLEKLVG